MSKEGDLSVYLLENLHQIAEEIVEMQYQQMPAIDSQYGDAGRKKNVEDVKYHLKFLVNAYNYESPELFGSYTEWLGILFKHLDFSTSDMVLNMQITKEVLASYFDPHVRSSLFDILDLGISRLSEEPSDISCYLEKSRMPELVRDYSTYLLNNDVRAAYDLIMEAIRDGTELKEIYLNVFQCSQYEIGRLWQMNAISVAREHFCTAATQKIMAQLYPYMFSGSSNGRNMVAACVGNELHEMGIRMVADFFEMDGWNSHYLGANTPSRNIIGAAAEEKADLLLLSVTMISHLDHLRDVISKIRKNDKTKNIRIIVGGYPFKVDGSLWRKVGADASARNAQEAVSIANAM